MLVAGYLIAILDRANLGVAALTMNADLGLSAAAFGVAASVFFVPTCCWRCRGTWRCSGSARRCGSRES
ncbi:Tartrate transporter [Amycolatopsis methanolica 239]|uniref:Tartrate transporter n=1 Tax=Amycolatopsis methanolica 239 TaxID=1068978 RepID=A0A076MYL0_AMYME|nr:Tartrate transporter [Amycolatopsis methanolica 239]